MQWITVEDPPTAYEESLMRSLRKLQARYQESYDREAKPLLDMLAELRKLRPTRQVMLADEYSEVPHHVRTLFP